MVDKIFELKNMLLEEVMKEARERGTERLSGDKIDMIKDLAEAEKSCWEAEYYKSVTKAMGQGSGYNTGGGTGSSATYTRMMEPAMYGGMMDRQGYSGSMGHQDIKDTLSRALQNASPEEREHIRNEVNMLMGSMR